MVACAERQRLSPAPEGLNGPFHGVAPKYLPNSLGYRQLFDRFHDAVTPQQFFFHALRNHYVNV
jgi:hypothetical protein